MFKLIILSARRFIKRPSAFTLNLHCELVSRWCQHSRQIWPVKDWTWAWPFWPLTEGLTFVWKTEKKNKNKNSDEILFNRNGFWPRDVPSISKVLEVCMIIILIYSINIHCSNSSRDRVEKFLRAFGFQGSLTANPI